MHKHAQNTSVDSDCTAPQRYQFKQVVWSNGAVQALPTKDDAADAAGNRSPLNFWELYLHPTHSMLWRDGIEAQIISALPRSEKILMT